MRDIAHFKDSLLRRISETDSAGNQGSGSAMKFLTALLLAAGMLLAVALSGCSLARRAYIESAKVDRTGLYKGKRIGIRLPAPEHIVLQRVSCALCDGDSFMDPNTDAFLKDYFSREIATRLADVLKARTGCAGIALIPADRIAPVGHADRSITTRKLKRHKFARTFAADSLDILINLDHLFIGRGQTWHSTASAAHPFSTRSKHVGVDIYFSLHDFARGGDLFDAEASFTRNSYSWGITKKVWDEQIDISTEWLFKEIAYDYYELPPKSP